MTLIPHVIPVWVIQDWIREDGATFSLGSRLLLPLAAYRKWGRSDYFARDFQRVRHWSGVEYLHALGPCGNLLWPTTRKRPPVVLAPPIPIPFKEPPPEPEPEPGVVHQMPLPKPGVIRRGCGGCAKRARAHAT